MGLRDIFKTWASPTQIVPNPIDQSRDNFYSGNGNGQLISVMRRVLPGSHKDWSRVAGDIGLNSVAAIGIDWYVRNFSQATPQIQVRLENGETKVVREHPLLDVMREPMPGYTASLVWGWVLQDFKFFGNAYLRKIRANARGEVIGLQYLPQDMVRPIGDGKNPLTHYQYRTDGRQYDIRVEDIIHFRYGRDPFDIRIGRAPLQSTLREIAADNTASSAAYGLLINGAIPSMIVGPDSNNNADNLSMDDARNLKDSLVENLTGDNAGGVVVMTASYKFDRVSFSPQELALDMIRRVPEERIAAALGLNPMVLGLGAGLDRSTYSNYEAAQQAAWEDGMIPTLRALSETLTVQLLPDFTDDPKEYVTFDYEKVRALADDVNALAVRSERLYRCGIIDRAQAKRLVGIEPMPDDEGVLSNNATSNIPGAVTDNTTAQDMQKSVGREVPYQSVPFFGYELLPDK